MPDMNTDILLECKNVGFRYKNSPWIFRNIDLKIYKDEITGLVGPSGYGKSTISKLLAGYEQPTEGEILWKGKPLPKKGYCPVQMIYQHPEKALDPRMRLKKSICEGWIPDDDLLKRFGIKKELWFERYPNELSGGEMQRFCIARVLSPKTEFIIADEMTTMLDAITQAQIWNALLEEVRKREIGLLVITHNTSLAKKLCTRIIDLRELNISTNSKVDISSRSA